MKRMEGKHDKDIYKFFIGSKMRFEAHETCKTQF